MGRGGCCDKGNVKKGAWSPEEDAKLKDYIQKNGTGGNWIALPQKVGLRRCGKSCRLRWLNYLRPNIKHGHFSEEEDRIICSMYATIGSRWSVIAGELGGRTDNDIKNYWNTKLKKKLIMSMASTTPTPTPTPSPSALLVLPPSNKSITTSPFLQNPSASPTSNYMMNSCYNLSNPMAMLHHPNQTYTLYTTTNDGYSISSSSSSSDYACSFSAPHPEIKDHSYYSSIQEIKDLINSNSSSNFIYNMQVQDDDLDINKLLHY